jgi:hypothetical protein
MSAAGQKKGIFWPQSAKAGQHRTGERLSDIFGSKNGLESMRRVSAAPIDVKSLPGRNSLSRRPKAACDGLNAREDMITNL